MGIKKFGKWMSVMMVAFILVLSGCSSNASKGSSGSNDDDLVTIRVAWWGNQDRHNKTLEAIEFFEEQYPNIRVEAEFTDWDGYWQKLNTQAAGNDLPDVIQMDTTRLNEYDENGLIIDLSSLIKDGTLNLDDVDDVYQEVLIDGERTLGISLGANAFAIVYNEELAAKHGINFSPGYTYDDFIDMLTTMKIEIGDGFYGFDFSSSEFELFNLYARSAGQAMFNEEGTGVGFEEQTLVDFFTRVQEMTHDEIALTPEVEAAIVEAGEVFQSVTVVAQLVASNQLVSRSEVTDVDLDLALLPTVEGQHGNWVRSSMAFSITSHSKQQEAAATFIDFFTNSIEANEILQADRGVPTSSTVRDALKEVVSEPIRKTFDFLDVVAEHSSQADPLPPTGQTEVSSAFLRYIEALKHNTTTPKDAAQEFVEAVEGILK